MNEADIIAQAQSLSNYHLARAPKREHGDLALRHAVLRLPCQYQVKELCRPNVGLEVVFVEEFDTPTPCCVGCRDYLKRALVVNPAEHRERLRDAAATTWREMVRMGYMRLYRWHRFL